MWRKVPKGVSEYLANISAEKVEELIEDGLQVYQLSDRIRVAHTTDIDAFVRRRPVENKLRHDVDNILSKVT